MRLRLLSVALIVVVLLGACSQADELPDPSAVVQSAAQAFTDGFNNRDLTQFETYFATPAQGADAAGLAQTLTAAQTALANAADSDMFQLQDFAILSQQIDQTNNLATVRYRATVSIVRNETNAVFSGIVEENVALSLVNNQWLISGGDTPRITPNEIIATPGS